MIRRTRDLDGNISYFNYDQIEGSGIMTNIAKKIFSKLTSDTSKKLAGIAAEKIVQKSSEKIGEKIGEKVAKKIEGRKNNKVLDSSNPNITNETSGDKIIKLLQEQIKESKTNHNKFADTSQQFD